LNQGLEFVTLNASTGPIYIGKDAEIMEGSVIRGPLHSVTIVKLFQKNLWCYNCGAHSRVAVKLITRYFSSNKGKRWVLETQS
jgi:hypothetical protein